MTAREIVRYAGTLLQSDDIEELTNRLAQNKECIDDLDSDARTLFRCVELAVSEMLGNGFPVLFTVKTSAWRGRILFDCVTNRVLRVERDGAPVQFTVDGNGIYVNDDGQYTVVYCQIRQKLDTTEEEVFAGQDCSPFAIVYLTTRNYCLVTGRTDEASVWDQRYDEESSKQRLSRRARLPRRAWR